MGVATKKRGDVVFICGSWTKRAHLLVLLAVTACATPPPKVAPPPSHTLPQAKTPPRVQPIRPRPTKKNVQVGLLLPLSGPAAKEGEALLRGAHMALFDGHDSHVALLPFDTQGTPEGARQAGEEALSHQVDIILGPLLTPSLRALQEVVGSTPIVSLSNVPEARNNTTVIAGLSIEEQVNTALRTLQAQGKTRLALLAPETPYGHYVAQVLQNSAETYGAVVVRQAFFDPSQTDFTNVVKPFALYAERHAALQDKIRALGSVSAKRLKALRARLVLGPVDFDALFLTVLRRSHLITLAAQLAFYDAGEPDVQLVGLHTWSDFSHLAQEPSLKGAWFVAPSTQKAFQQRYQALYNTPWTSQVALSYDMTRFLIALAPYGYDPEQMTVQNFQSLTGRLSVRDGLVTRTLGVVSVFGKSPTTELGTQVFAPGGNASTQDDRKQEDAGDERSPPLP